MQPSKANWHPDNAIEPACPVPRCAKPRGGVLRIYGKPAIKSRFSYVDPRGSKLRRLPNTRTSIAEAVANDAPGRSKCVSEPDLFAFRVIPAIVRDRHLVDPALQPGDLRSQLGLYAKAIFTQLNFVGHALTKRFVARLHIRQVQIVKQIRQPRQHAIRDAMPEQMNALRRPAEARTEHDVGVAIKNRRDKLGDI